MFYTKIEVSTTCGDTVEEGLIEAMGECWKNKCDVVVEHNDKYFRLKYNSLCEFLQKTPKED